MEDRAVNNTPEQEAMQRDDQNAISAGPQELKNLLNMLPDDKFAE